VNTVAFDPSMFERLPLPSYSENPCSPRVERAFRGLCLAAPKKVALARKPRLPIAGTYRVDGPFLNRFWAMASEITVVAVHATGHVPRAATLCGRDDSPLPTHLDERSPGFETTVLTGWFNLDLFEWIDGIPREPGRVYVFATVGDVVSSTVTVELERP